MRYIILFSLILLITTACSQKTEDNAEINGDNAKINMEEKKSNSADAADNKKEETEKKKFSLFGKDDSNKVELKQPDPSRFKNLTSDYTGAIIKTNFGDIKVVFYGQESPKTVNNFLNLAKINFYNQTKFHRVIKDFMIQGGDPNSRDDDWSNDGTGGPGYKFEDEMNTHKLVKGSLAMANSGPNTNGSQFFIVTAGNTPWLDGKHTNFGEVTAGMDIVEKIENVDINNNNHPIKDVTIESIELIK